MRFLDLEREKINLDREITFFHFRKARKMVRQALRQSRKRGEWFYVYYFAAQHYILRENFPAALRLLMRAVDLRPYDGCSYNDTALCWAEMGRPEKAFVWFNRGISREPDCPSLYHNKGWLLNRMGKHKQAKVCFCKALEIDPDRPETLYSLGDSCLYLGENKPAEKYFRRAAEIVRNKSEYLYGIINQRISALN